MSGYTEREYGRRNHFKGGNNVFSFGHTGFEVLIKYPNGGCPTTSWI